MPENSQRKPDWLRVRIPGGDRYKKVRSALSGGRLHTVCEEANCPNMGECWESGTATFMILGDICTRGCRFCAVGRGHPSGVVDKEEPIRLAATAGKMGLDYAVITSVTRDDLEDGGASIFAETVGAIRKLSPPPLVELLIPDLRGRALEKVLRARPDVLAHNIEVVERLTPLLRHSSFSYRRSLDVLFEMRSGNRDLLTKSSIMLGLGETDKEVEIAMKDLREVDVNILVLGQYLRPTLSHAEVVEYIPPERFSGFADMGKAVGFGFVAAGPLVRTSYRAAEAFAKHHLS